MEKKSIYCPNCGEKQIDDMQFCSNCGYDFDNKVFPKETSKSEENILKKVQKFLQHNFKKYQHILKDKRMIGGLSVLAVLALAYLLFGGMDIAGTYESEDTINNSNHSETLKISRNGQATIGLKNEFEQLEYKATVDLIESENGYSYYADQSQDMAIEITLPKSEFQNGAYLLGLEKMVNFAGLEQKEKGNMITISGEISPYIAEQMDASMNDIEIIKGDNSDVLIMLDTNFYSID